jgi:hypothetical protein
VLVGAASTALLTAVSCGSPASAPSARPDGSTKSAGTAAPRAPTTPAPTTVPSGRTITIGWIGDTVPSGSDYGLPPDPDALFAPIADTLRRPDLMVGNMEGTLATGGASKCGAGSAECYAFRSPPSYAAAFKRAGFDLMSMANNHSLDFGPQGLADTKAALTGAGLRYTGLPGQITVVTVRGVRVAVVGFAPYDWTAPLTTPQPRWRWCSPRGRRRRWSW